MSEQVSEQAEPYDEICPICGASMNATHAPWCQFPDGTPVPETLRATVKAQTECIQAFDRMCEKAPDVGTRSWAIAVVIRTIVETLWPIGIRDPRYTFHYGNGIRVPHPPGVSFEFPEQDEKRHMVLFLGPVWAQADGDPDKMAKLLADNEMLSKHFTIDSPEVQAVMAEE